jgi:hypothetical protein
MEIMSEQNSLTKRKNITTKTPNFGPSNAFNSPKPILQPYNLKLDNGKKKKGKKRKTRHKSKAVPTDKYAAGYNTYSKKHDPEKKQKKGKKKTTAFNF